MSTTSRESLSNPEVASKADGKGDESTRRTPSEGDLEVGVIYPGSDVASAASSSTTTRGGDPRPSPSAASRLTVSSFLTALVMGLMRFSKDFTTFLIRGGLSSMMFFMDQLLSLVLAVVSWIPGGNVIMYIVRGLMWGFQLLIWIVYTVLELIAYLPWKALVIYLPVLLVIYLALPDGGRSLITTMYKLSHAFLHLIKSIVSSQLDTP